jgi:hypothetical protein
MKLAELVFLAVWLAFWIGFAIVAIIWISEVAEVEREKAEGEATILGAPYTLDMLFVKR